MSCPNLEHYSSTMESDCSVLCHNDDSSTNAFSDSGSEFCMSGKSSTSEEYSEEEEEDIKRLSRKRTRSRYTYQNKKQQKQKSLRNSGASYTSLSKSKKEVNARCIRPPCGAKCRLRCNALISESMRLDSYSIYTPDQYTSLIATAKKTGPAYKVRELSYEAFNDLKALQEEWGHNFSTNKDNQKVIWRDIKVLQVNKENPHSFFYKTSYKDIDFQEVCLRNNLKPWSCINLCAIYSERLSLPQIKQKDIKELVDKNHIPKNFYESYNKYLFIT
ncbi:uncharacterized protein LOC128856745 [Anastrepha ludens]|uniref:uncharacterized protein LOC128856745 n=1 Tax=Anastrepha ludens TaxID=28586 RepID=UPI0023B0CDB4|nr:uncharacterized protein LOC128856745 [Anastrepha ludens]